jgi:hypothetical protein
MPKAPSQCTVCSVNHHVNDHGVNARTLRAQRSVSPALMLAVLGLHAAALGVCASARADGAATPPVSDLIERIERLEASNRALAGEVETLRSRDGDAWLTEQRAEEIRGIVTDVLADSSTRTSLQSAGMTAGWNDGFFLQSPDERFLLQAKGLIQARYIFSSIEDGVSGVNIDNNYIADNVENRSGFDMPNTQLDLRGHVFGPGWQYRVRGGFSSDSEVSIGQNPLANLGPGSGDFQLIDAWVRAELSDEWALRVGQFKLPFAREQLVDAQFQMPVARSTIVEHLGVGISQGIELAFTSSDVRAMVAYSNGGDDNVYGILKGAGTMPVNSPWDNDTVNWAVTGRFEWKGAGQWSQFNSMTSPPGDEFAMLFGIACNAQEGDPDSGTTSNQGEPNTWINTTADATLFFGGATLFGSFTYSYMDSGSAFVEGSNGLGVPDFFDIGRNESWGAVLQASYYFVPKWEVFGRFEYGKADIPNIGNILNPPGTSSLSNGNDLQIATIGVNWYIDGEDLKWSADGGIALSAVDGVWWNGANGWRAAAEENELVFRTMLQLAF